MRVGPRPWLQHEVDWRTFPQGIADAHPTEMCVHPANRKVARIDALPTAVFNDALDLLALDICAKSHPSGKVTGDTLVVRKRGFVSLIKEPVETPLTPM